MCCDNWMGVSSTPLLLAVNICCSMASHPTLVSSRSFFLVFPSILQLSVPYIDPKPWNSPSNFFTCLASGVAIVNCGRTVCSYTVRRRMHRLKVSTFCIPSLTGKPEQQRFTNYNSKWRTEYWPALAVGGAARNLRPPIARTNALLTHSSSSTLDRQPSASRNVFR